jgi:hypothetical protein
VADARNAQLKHVRKTDGKNDPALDTAEASANKVLAGEAPGVRNPEALPPALPQSLPNCCAPAVRMHTLHRVAPVFSLQRAEPPASAEFAGRTHSRRTRVFVVQLMYSTINGFQLPHLQPGARHTLATRRRCTLSWSPWPPTRRWAASV